MMDIRITGGNEDMKMDGLKEMGSIGAAHASSALSTLVGKEILVEVSECFICKAQELPSAFEDAHDTVVAVLLEAYGEGKGEIMLILDHKMAIDLAAMVLGREHEDGHAFDDMDRDAICEIGNICASAYLSAVAKFLGTTLLPSPPGVAVDMLHAILQYPAALAETESDCSVVIKTRFVYGKEACLGFMLYMPDRGSQAALVEKFKVM